MLKQLNKKTLFLSSITFLIIWQIASWIYPPVIVPSPYLVIKNMVMYLGNPEFYADLSITLMRGLIGYVISVVLGILIAFSINHTSLLKNILYPYLLTLQIIPRISWILIAMIWFPLNSQIVIFIISITIIPTIAINTLEGLENIDPSLLEMAKVYKIKGPQIIRNIYLPSIAPYIFSGMKIALGITWKTVVMAELLTVQTGIGARMSYAKTSFSTDHILALTVYIIIIGLFFQGVLSKVKAHFERWKI
ncbi:MAG: ABC transporter permease [Clostridiales bacterium]|nr:ABC transporter permease [Clostridiales bacterium]